MNPRLTSPQGETARKTHVTMANAPLISFPFRKNVTGILETGCNPHAEVSVERAHAHAHAAANQGLNMHKQTLSDRMVGSGAKF